MRSGIPLLVSRKGSGEMGNVWPVRFRGLVAFAFRFLGVDERNRRES